MLALVVVVRVDDVELAADALWSLGVVAIEERGGDSTDGDEIELWTSLGDDRHSVERAVRQSIEPRVPCRWRLVDVDETVADSWRDHAQPTWVQPDLVVVPAWLPVDVQSPGVTVIAIEPGATFGAGDHPTTVLSLRAMRALLEASSAQTAAVLDVGCGSGVLAIAAVMLGARTAHGIDISPAAVPVTTANAVRNGVASLVSVSTDPLSNVTGRYGIVVANILAPALIELSTDLRRVLADDGSLVISGVLADRFDHVAQALQPLRVVQVDELDGWAAVTLRR